MTNQSTPAVLTYITPAIAALKTEATRTAYALWLDRFSQWYAARDYPPIEYDLIIGYMAQLELEGYKTANRIQALSAIKALCKTTHNSDRELIGIYTNMLIKSIVPDKHQSELRGQVIPPDDIAKILDVCKADPAPAGRRDASIVSLLHSTGIRRGECAGLTIANLDTAGQRVLLENTKNKKDRVAYFNDGAGKFLADWLSIRGSQPGHIYWRTKRNGLLWPDKEISGQAIYNIIRRRCEEASVPFYAPHDFRRTLISNLLDANVDISMISKIVGHSSAAMTARYDRRDDVKMKSAIDKIETPY